MSSGIIEPIVGQIVYAREQVNKLGHEERAEIRQIGQQVVNMAQMRELSAVMELLADELLPDRQKKYYICIDLDENWSSNLLRYRLIRAIETARDFNSRIPQLKVICAIREDLLDRVFRFTRNQVQQEKYRSLYLQLFWKPKELVDVLNLRINQLVAHRYAKKQLVTSGDILPNKVRQSNTVTYIISRTLNTPRDVIMFFNECIKQADGKTKINQTDIIAAEGIYSELRLRALADEWSADYSTLGELMLKRTKKSFQISNLDRDMFEDRILDYLLKAQQKESTDYIYRLVEEKMDFDIIIPELLHILYQVGVVGIKKAKRIGPTRETRYTLQILATMLDSTSIQRSFEFSESIPS